MANRLLIAGNWKMNLSLGDAISLASEVAARPSPGVDVAVMPPFLWLLPVKDALGDSNVQLGAQNCYWESSGAYTGEVSATMLSGTCDFILAGHSERRHVFNESDDEVGKKVIAILEAGVAPILCVGETIDQRRDGVASDVVTRQLDAGLAGVESKSLAAVTIAYEPVWAIGTGVAATSSDAQEMCSIIREWLVDRHGQVGSSVRILYGGSVTPANASELLAQTDIDGGLVGGASLKSQTFLEIVAAAESVSRM